MPSHNTIDTERFSRQLRQRCINLDEMRLLITNFRDTEQEEDLTVPPNCNGYGRIHHFRRTVGDGWPVNPLPIDPAFRSLGLPRKDMMRAQVFQAAACNWRCWYCFVPFELLSADPARAAWLSCADLLDLYLSQPEPPPIIDLTGGQPGLTPEWVPWMMREIRSRGLESNIYLWSDDNLSNDYFWRYLDTRDIELIEGYTNYGRVCCFKGFDRPSFQFNTLAAPELFERQFELMARFVELDIDLYAYTTFTTPTADTLESAMPRFVDRLQELDENLPLRTVPLKIQAFTPVQDRLSANQEAALHYQQWAVEAWQQEVASRYDSSQLMLEMVDVP